MFLVLKLLCLPIYSLFFCCDNFAMYNVNSVIFYACYIVGRKSSFQLVLPCCKLLNRLKINIDLTWLDLKIHVPDSHTEQFRNSFFIRTIREWNQLEECQIRAVTVNIFRTAVHDGERIAEIAALIKETFSFIFFVELGLIPNQTYSDQLILIASHWFHDKLLIICWKCSP